jgi:hypothetical protein
MDIGTIPLEERMLGFFYDQQEITCWGSASSGIPLATERQHIALAEPGWDIHGEANG